MMAGGAPPPTDLTATACGVQVQGGSLLCLRDSGTAHRRQDGDSEGKAGVRCGQRQGGDRSLPVGADGANELPLWSRALPPQACTSGSSEPPDSEHCREPDFSGASQRRLPPGRVLFSEMPLSSFLPSIRNLRSCKNHVHVFLTPAGHHQGPEGQASGSGHHSVLCWELIHQRR